MATIKELLEERTSALRELTDRIEEQVAGDADLEELTRLADELSAKGDDFAATVTRAVEALRGEQQDGGGGEDGGEQGNEADADESEG